MTIYFMTARALGLVKIGWSDNPHRRLCKMQSDSPVPLVFERVCEGGLEDEQELHRRFAADRRNGEWFNLSAGIAVFMDGLEFPPAKPTGPNGRPMKFAGTDIGALRGELGLSLEAFARKIGLNSKGHVSTLERTGICSVRVAVAIEALSAGRIDAADLCEDVRIARHGEANSPAALAPATGQIGDLSGPLAAQDAA